MASSSLEGSISSALVSPEWVHERLGSGASNIRVLDATWHLPNSGRHGVEDFQEGHITGARYFNIDEVCHRDSSLPHMLPTKEILVRWLASNGISPESTVVCYSANQSFTASARLWWTLRVLGHPGPVYVLNGGLPAWKKSGFPTSTATTAPNLESNPSSVAEEPEKYHPRLELLISLDDFRSQNFTIVDARPRRRFLGQDPEPRPGLPSGHLSGSLSVPALSILDENGMGFLPKNQLRDAFDEAIQQANTKPLAVSCGSGVTACILCLALHELGHDNVPVYDGSWVEYASQPDAKISK